VLRRGIGARGARCRHRLVVAGEQHGFLASVLYETSPYDPATYACVATLLLVVAAAPAGCRRGGQPGESE